MHRNPKLPTKVLFMILLGFDGTAERGGVEIGQVRPDDQKLRFLMTGPAGTPFDSDYPRCLLF
jgi:hypothetical protein